MKSVNAPYKRKVTPLERLFIVLAELDMPFSNQMVLEGTGTLDESRWKRAVEEACEANPGSRVVCRGRSMWARWSDSGVSVPVRSFDGSGWSAQGPEGAPFFFEPLPFRTSHSCEIVLVHGDPARVVFRSLHAVMDGRGTLFWAQDVFRALRGEPLVGSSSTMTDVEIISRLNYPVNLPRKPKNCLAPTGAIDGDEPGHTWKRARVQGRFSKLLPQVAILTAGETRKQGPGNVCFNIPVDLRPRMPDLRSTANLTRRIILNTPPEATVGDIQKQLEERLDSLSGDPKLLKLLCYVPEGWIKSLFQSARTKNLRNGLYRSSGSISNLGRLPMDTLGGGGFEVKSGFFVPPGTDGKPFFITLSGCGGSIDIVLAMPKILATNGRLDRLLSNIVSGLKPN